jgi:hypothetical protein
VGKRTTAPRKARAGEKWCPKHEGFVPLSEFGVDRARYDGLQGWCKACMNEEQGRRRAMKAEKRIEGGTAIMGDEVRAKIWFLRLAEQSDGLTFNGPSAGDALRYACLEEAFKLKPVPPGKTKRELYCGACEGNHGHCVFGGSVLSRRLGVIQTAYEAAPVRSGPGQGRTKEAA